MIHKLKTINPFFEDVVARKKNFEIRKNDRNYQTGDRLILNEYLPYEKRCTGRKCLRDVVYVINHEEFPDGVKEGYVVMGIRPIGR